MTGFYRRLERTIFCTLGTHHTSLKNNPQAVLPASTDTKWPVELMASFLTSWKALTGQVTPGGLSGIDQHYQTLNREGG